MAGHLVPVHTRLEDARLPACARGGSGTGCHARHNTVGGGGHEQLQLQLWWFSRAVQRASKVCSRSRSHNSCSSCPHVPITIRTHLLICCCCCWPTLLVDDLVHTACEFVVGCVAQVGGPCLGSGSARLCYEGKCGAGHVHVASVVAIQLGIFEYSKVKLLGCSGRPSGRGASPRDFSMGLICVGGGMANEWLVFITLPSEWGLVFVIFPCTVIVICHTSLYTSHWPPKKVTMATLHELPLARLVSLLTPGSARTTGDACAAGGGAREAGEPGGECGAAGATGDTSNRRSPRCISKHFVSIINIGLSPLISAITGVPTEAQKIKA